MVRLEKYFIVQWIGKYSYFLPKNKEKHRVKTIDWHGNLYFFFKLSRTRNFEKKIRNSHCAQLFKLIALCIECITKHYKIQTKCKIVNISILSCYDHEPDKVKSSRGGYFLNISYGGAWPPGPLFFSSLLILIHSTFNISHLMTPFLWKKKTKQNEKNKNETKTKQNKTKTKTNSLIELLTDC